MLSKLAAAFAFAAIVLANPVPQILPTILPTSLSLSIPVAVLS